MTIYRSSYTFVFLFFITVSSLHRFSPIDNYLIDCGSAPDTSVFIDGRRFTADSNAPFLFTTRTISIHKENAFLGSSPIYNTARVFTRSSKYAFTIRDQGTHMVRLHFGAFDSLGFNLSIARFHVSLNGLRLLNNFTGADSRNPKIKEYIIWADGGDKLEISFIPIGNPKFAFVNAIEVFSVPKDLIPDTAISVVWDSTSNVRGLKKQALETVYRVTVGGPKVTPFNDSLWRTWVPDGQFLKSSSGSSVVYFGGRIRFQAGGASREICPDNVHSTARTISSKNASTVPRTNITWEFQVEEGYKYLIRTHFCDIASPSPNMLYFNVYVNKHLAYKDLNPSNGILASPFYADFLIPIRHPSHVLTLSVGSSKNTSFSGIDAILNGIEIMKLNNSFSSFDGEFSISMGSFMKMSSKGKLMVGALCMFLIVSLFFRWSGNGKYVAWSPLQLDDN